MAVALFGAAHAEPVYTCPANGMTPIPLPPSCPAPFYGLLYPLEHATADDMAAHDLERAARAADDAADSIRRLREADAGRVSWVWVALGVVAGGAVGALLGRGL